MAFPRFAVAALSLVPLGVSPALALMAPAPLQAQPLACSGTLLQLQVQQQGVAAFDRFRFELGLAAEAASKTEALEQLNLRLAALRRVVAPLASGALTIPAPSTYRSGGGSSGPVRERASTSVSGQVSKANYDALIQAAGRLPGVNLQGFTAQALGLRRVQLLRIDQRSGGIRPVPYGMAAARSFNPDEAPAPQRSVSLALDYCLS